MLTGKQQMYLRSLNDMIFLVLWYIFFIVQGILSYGTAYRLAKTGGDNGVSLYGWLFVMNLASAIPGLGIYLWNKYKYLDAETQYNGGQLSRSKLSVEQQNFSKCSQLYDYDMSSCPHCGCRP